MRLRRRNARSSGVNVLLKKIDRFIAEEFGAGTISDVQDEQAGTAFRGIG